MSTRIEDDNRDTIEYFRSLPEMYAALRTRRAVQEDHAFLTDSCTDYCDPKRSFNGFSSVEELRRQVVGGAEDIKAVKEVQAFSHDIKCGTLKTRERRPSVVTGRFRMDKYLNKDPMCFDRSKRVKKPNKVIKLLINMSANGSTPASDIEKASKVVARNVVALEKAGYRVRVTICKCNEFYDDGRYSHHTVAVDLKDEGHCINYRKLCLGLSVMMYRGVFFGWMACEPGCDYSMGHAESSEEIVGPYLNRVIGSNGVWYMHLYDLMDLVHKNNDDLHKASDALCATIVEAMG